MTADERIEKLLNRFGQTIEDLPKPNDPNHYTYGWYAKQNLDKAAREWGEKDFYFHWDVIGDYACHLCDVIDRMEIALETATRWMPCDRCEKEDNCQDMDCNLSMKDRYLGGSCID